VTTSPVPITDIEISMPMKMISYVLHDVNASFEGDIGIKI